MKAAHGSQPAPRQHGNYARNYSASVNPGLNISSSANPKMVMPPFLRLDSTGEVSSEDGPAVQSKGIHRHRTPVYQFHRQGVSTSVCNGLLGNWMPHLTPQKPGFSSNQLTVSPQTMAQGGISALDQLIDSRQSVNCVARQAMPSTVKMAHPSGLQRPSQYKNWGVNVMMAHGYPWLPQGVFPCHLFDAIHSGSQLWQPPSSGHFPLQTGAPNLVGTLLNTCEPFATQSYHHPHPVPPLGCKPMHEKVTNSSPHSDFKTPVLHPKSGMYTPKPDNIEQSTTAGCDKSTSVSYSEVEVLVKCDSPPDSQDLITVSHCTSGALEPSIRLCKDCDQEISAEPLQEKNMAAIHSSMQKSQHLPSKPSAEEESIAEPSFSHDLQNDDASSSVDSGITADCLDNQEDTAIRIVPNVVCSMEEPQNVQFQCGGLSGWSEVDVDTDSSDDDSQDDDADSDDQDDESDNEVDLESQAEAMNCFRVCELSEANFLHKKSKEKEIDQENNAEQKRSPPKPDREANRRWDMHHPQRVPPGRTSKVQFACGNDVDEVHTIERETLTVMEIQKLRDISKQHNGRARHILRMKSSKCDFEEDDKSQGDRMSSSGGLYSSDSGVDVCDGASDVQVNSGVGEQKQSAAVKLLKHPNDAKEKTDVDDDSEEENDDYGVAFWSESSVSTESEKEDGDESEDEKDNDEEVEEDDGFVIEFGNE
eukprot:GHVL01014603.1.p1 GENE.GHVL01014603.1~~GHVL01014603.1.p1  ORF type:complete len:703 (+),score=111.93 GHVL01014603.1:249-2357(+)